MFVFGTYVQYMAVQPSCLGYLAAYMYLADIPGCIARIKKMVAMYRSLVTGRGSLPLWARQPEWETEQKEEEISRLGKNRWKARKARETSLFFFFFLFFFSFFFSFSFSFLLLSLTGKAYGELRSCCDCDSSYEYRYVLYVLYVLYVPSVYSPRIPDVVKYISASLADGRRDYRATMTSVLCTWP